VTQHSEQLALGGHEHLVHFFQTEDDLARTVVSYLHEGLSQGAAAVVIATEPHRLAFEAKLRQSGFDLDAGERSGTYRSFDAAETLARLMPHGQLDRTAFDEVIGGVVRAAARGGRPVIAYGEMVALLWETGDVPGAIELETMWNELAERVRFSLLCAYRSVSVDAPEHAGALDDVCRLHSSRLNTATRTFAPTPAAPAAARGFLEDTLGKWGHNGDTAADAKLILSELATNVVVHAGTTFRVLALSDDHRLRLEITDTSHEQPIETDQPPEAPSGRGVHVVATLAHAWGVRDTPDGKTVWAELTIT
jgi:anti-sigma regulatory factor (Ser/Thr protein kinase)